MTTHSSNTDGFPVVSSLATGAGESQGAPTWGRKEHPAAPPMDPMDVEALPPVDIDACSTCDGLGIIITGTESDTGAWTDEPCTRCDGSGHRYGWIALGGVA